MGCCITSRKFEDGRQVSAVVEIEQKILPSVPINIEKINELNTRFIDLPVWEGVRYSGHGFRKMKGYVFSGTSEELTYMRELFWRKTINRRSRKSAPVLWNHQTGDFYARK